MALLDDILTLGEAADRLGLSRQTVRNQLTRVRIHCRLFGKTYVTAT